MKKLLFSAVVLIYSAGLLAQSNKEDIALIQAMFGKEKKELVTQYLTIPENQSAKFWALYDEYEDKRKALGRERISVLEGYAKDYKTLDSKKATALMGKKFAWAQKYTQFQQTYFTKFSTAIGGLQASKLMQLEDYLENNIRLAIQNEIPFIGELDKKKVPPPPPPTNSL
jgi:hypothetical protein